MAGILYGGRRFHAETSASQGGKSIPLRLPVAPVPQRSLRIGTTRSRSDVFHGKLFGVAEWRFHEATGACCTSRVTAASMIGVHLDAKRSRTRRHSGSAPDASRPVRQTGLAGLTAPRPARPALAAIRRSRRGHPTVATNAPVGPDSLSPVDHLADVKAYTTSIDGVRMKGMGFRVNGATGYFDGTSPVTSEHRA